MRQNWWERALDTIADRGRDLLKLPTDSRRLPALADLCRKLLSSRGEASGIALARECLRLYQDLDASERLAFFELLDTDFGADLEQIKVATERYSRSASADDFLSLTDAVEAPRQELFRSLNMAPRGTAALVALRGDLLRVLGEHPQLKAVDADLKHVLSSWFNRGFLRLERIDWHSPAAVLEKLMHYESVHPIRGWEDLRRRLASDRCCFAFFHPAMPDEPLIFVEVALLHEIAHEIRPLLDVDAPVLDANEASTAIFYSINNTQLGLRGISFGNFLIKQVLAEQSAECTHIRHYATLSPLPGFRRAVEAALAGDRQGLTHEMMDALLEDHAAKLCTTAGADSPSAALVALLDQHPAEKTRVLTDSLKRLAVAYLTQPRADAVVDPVASFHLANGARLDRINPFADLSDRGLRQSFGVMANYLYDPREIEANHERFVSDGEIVMSKELARIHKRVAGLRPAGRDAVN